MTETIGVDQRPAVLLVRPWNWISLGLFGPACFSAQAADKSIYDVFRATPASAMREFTTDRPDFTESPFTVDAGHYQLEMDFARLTRVATDGEQLRTWEVAPLNVRVGVLNDLEMGIMVNPYGHQTLSGESGPRHRISGFGDFTVRTKFNFSGNDSGVKIASGLIADVTAPTSTAGLGADKTEFGLTFPVAFDLPWDWHGGAMTRMEFLHDRSSGDEGVWSNSVTLGHELLEKVSGYVELGVQSGSGSAVTFFSFGVSWLSSPNTQFDAGAVLGLSRAADDFQLFSGLSRRF